jgi:hypothetical protein
MVIATQLLQDLPDAITGNTALKFVFSYHEPGTVQRLQSVMRMTELEKSLMHRMPVGSCMLFDQSAIQGGKPYPAYVETDVVDSEEKKRLQESIKRIGIVEVNTAENEQIRAETTNERRPALPDVFDGIDIPSVSVYRFLIALARTGSEKDAIRFVREKRWITSTFTLYGGRSQPSLVARARDNGYYSEEGKLNVRARALITPLNMLQKQGMNTGSEEHIALMKKTIQMIQDRGNFAFVPRPRESFDVGELWPTKDRKGLWNYSKVTAYEIQTTASRVEIERCVERQKQLGTELLFVTNSHKVKKEIETITEKKYKVLILKPFETK